MLYRARRAAGCDSDLVGSKFSAVSFVAVISLPIVSTHFNHDAFCGGVLDIPPPTREPLPTDYRFSDVLSKPLVPPHPQPGRAPEAGRAIYRMSSSLQPSCVRHSRP